MKKLIYLIILCGCTVQYPQSMQDAPEGASVIKVHSNLSSDEAYKKTMQVLNMEGFSFKQTDSESGLIETEYTLVRGQDLKLNVLIQEENPGSLVIFKGKVPYGRSDFDVQKINNTGFGIAKGFMAMHKMAGQIPNNMLSYEKISIQR